MQSDVKMEPINHNFNVGKPGIILLITGFLLNFLNTMTKSDFTFYIGSLATILACVYYSIQIYKSKKK